ncbi:molybdopterin binding domain protein [Desulfofarcimen acetoxidans DSM 771]|uniref:Molybdopterin molybdenumtransferase n=1 Tax=Desulfofarcimen acetoxidans (strain ATCC 49208 / DSM 771 / KCTC 5769 / VKM B-1644 / 5575) TaxID=485916 RepID=C8W6W0_DESAS|nr:molybdopterin-binding protein [Desulfofarcimen acetoxidans]ACV64219.1 molybdopterin binding domain protein [Desulfofarcimen acetoxidans DSM 771]
MKSIRVEDAVGSVLCHDITRIIPGESKGPAFKKGHIITEEDIPAFLDLGKEHVFVWEVKEGIIHENEAAERMAIAAAGENIVLMEPSEGKVTLKAKIKGLLKIDVATLNIINETDELMMGTLRNNRLVYKDTIIAGTKIIPLIIDEEKIKRVEDICQKQGPIIRVLPLLPKRTAIIITGNEVYRGRIKDSFTPIVAKKLKKMGCEIFKQTIVDDNVDKIAATVLENLAEGAEMILVTGGMSVDPDDLTPAGIKKAGGTIVTYGTPVLPGAMFMMSYINGIPVLGLPGCVMYSKTTIFDIVLPRILSGEVLQKSDFAQLGHGGLCQKCKTCRFPDCALNTGN